MSCPLGDLAAGATAEVELRTRATSKGSRSNAAEVSSPTAMAPGAVLEARATARVRGAVVRLSKTVSSQSVDAGERVKFRLTARSRAARAVAGVRVCDRLPRALELVAAPGARTRGGRACWTLRLRAGQTRRLKLTARADDLERTRRILNVATLRGSKVVNRNARAGVTVRGATAPSGRCSARACRVRAR